jgi:hypothetical protein
VPNAEDDPDPTQTDVGHQVLEALPGRRLRARSAQVGVDHPHLMRIPPQHDGAFA